MVELLLIDRLGNHLPDSSQGADLVPQSGQAQKPESRAPEPEEANVENYEPAFYGLKSTFKTPFADARDIA